MNPQFSTTLLQSFHLALDNWITQRGQAYINVTTPLFYQADPTLPGYVTYAAPFRGWVYDSGVSGAVILNSVSGSLGLGGTGIVSRGQSGMMVDYTMGRVIFPASVGTNATISGTYAVKEINVYKTDETQENIVFTNKYYLNSRFGDAMQPPPVEAAMVTPAIFIGKAVGKTQPLGFGGNYWSESNLVLTILAENQLQADGCASLIEEFVDNVIPHVPPSGWPLNFYGDYKSTLSGYNYETYKEQYGSRLYSVLESKTSKVGDWVKVDQSIYVGLADVTLATNRTIH